MEDQLLSDLNTAIEAINKAIRAIEENGYAVELKAHPRFNRANPAYLSAVLVQDHETLLIKRGQVLTV